MDPQAQNRPQDGNRRRKDLSVDGVNVGILWDDYLIMPASAKQETARCRCLRQIARDQIEGESRGTKKRR